LGNLSDEGTSIPLECQYTEFIPLKILRDGNFLTVMHVSNLNCAWLNQQPLTPTTALPYFTPNQGEFLWVKRMGNAVTTEIKVLSAGAVEPGIVKVIDSYQRETAHNVKVTFATAPTILKRIGEANIADLVIAPPAVLDEWVKAGKAAAADRVTVGRIGVGVMIRNGSGSPNIGTVDEFKRSLLSAESVV
jgi:Bacterial extracellular solute-binding protein